MMIDALRWLIVLSFSSVFLWIAGMWIFGPFFG
jgi:hypothetical protein